MQNILLNIFYNSFSQSRVSHISVSHMRAIVLMSESDVSAPPAKRRRIEVSKDDTDGLENDEFGALLSHVVWWFVRIISAYCQVIYK